MAIVPVGARRRGPASLLDLAALGWRTAVHTRPMLLLLPLIALLVLVTLFSPERQDDEAGYLELARNLANGHYATGRPDALLDADPAYPDLWFGPGLPLVLVGPVALDLPLWALRLSGPLFLFGALLVFFALVRRYVRTEAAVLATWALGLYVPFYTVLPNLHSEPLALLLLVLGLYAIARTSEGKSWTWVVVGAAALAGLALTRVAYGWVLTLLLVALLVWWALARSDVPRRLAGMVGLALALCIPWLAYTTVETGRVLQWGNSGSLSLYWMSSPFERDLGDWRQANRVFTDDDLAPHRPFFETLRGHPLPEQNARLERRAVENIRDHPAKYAENVVANVSRMLFDAPYSATPQRLTALAFALPNALLLAAVLLALVVALRVRGALPAAAAPFALLGLLAFALHALVAAYPRMLLPIVPIVVWFAAVAFANHVRVDTRALRSPPGDADDEGICGDRHTAMETGTAPSSPVARRGRVTW